MILEIKNILTPEELKQIAQISKTAEWQDGHQTAGKIDVQSKKNLEVKNGSDSHKQLARVVMLAMAEHVELEYAITPTGSSVPIFSKYTKGMSYPEHLDTPIVGYKNPSGSIFPSRFRADVSGTLFLNNPSDYEGGELVINSPNGSLAFKAQAGSLVTYPSNWLHHINKVTSGDRRVAVLWFQSLYRSPEQRQCIYQLRSATSKLIAKYPEEEELKRVRSSLNGLMQMFAD